MKTEIYKLALRNNGLTDNELTYLMDLQCEIDATGDIPLYLLQKPEVVKLIEKMVMNQIKTETLNYIEQNIAS